MRLQGNVQVAPFAQDFARYPFGKMHPSIPANALAEFKYQKTDEALPESDGTGRRHAG